jgi:hypothetical protein
VKSKILLYVAAILILAGRQWTNARPDSKPAGIVFAIGAVLLIVLVIVDGISMYKNRKKEAV